MPTNPQHPVSPHLQIYKLPLTALLSISHRITGIINCLGALLLVVVLASAAGGEGAFATTGALLRSWFGTLVLFGFSLCLYYHFCNGIRHLFWDVGMGFDLAAANKSAKITLIAAGVLTLLTWIVAIAAR